MARPIWLSGLNAGITIIRKLRLWIRYTRYLIFYNPGDLLAPGSLLNLLLVFIVLFSRTIKISLIFPASYPKSIISYKTYIQV
jgi:hypothetical protein